MFIYIYLSSIRKIANLEAVRAEKNIERIMSKIVTNIITKNDEGYTSYGSSIVSVQDTETGEVRTATVNYSPSKSEAEATAEAIEEASNKF